MIKSACHSAPGRLRIVRGPEGCLEMDEAHGISDYIPGAIPIGDDEGGKALIYMTGNKGWGLYLSGFGDLDAEDAQWIASNLRELLCECVGKEKL